MAEGFYMSVLALEFSTTLSAAASLFNGDEALIHTYETAHTLDMLYLVAYGAFLGMANLGAWYLQRRALNLIGIIAAGVAASADFAENLQLMQLTQALLGSGSPPDFWLLRLFVSTKFLMVCVSLLCLLPMMWPQGWLGKSFSVATLLLAPSTLLTLLGYYHFSIPMIAFIMVAWISLQVWMVKMRNRGDVTEMQDKGLAKTHAI